MTQDEILEGNKLIAEFYKVGITFSDVVEFIKWYNTNKL